MVTMNDLPPVSALLALARDVLVNELTPLLPEERRADARLIAECMAVAARAVEGGDEPMQAIIRELELLYEPLTPALCPHCGEREGPARREGAGQGSDAPSVVLLRRFANDLRNGVFDTSARHDRAARATLWRLTIARLRQSNPNFLAANGFD
jgi:hypothetical protein